MFRTLSLLFGVVLAIARPVSADVCPALDVLASSCGNGTCQGDFGESVQSCPQDCANPNTQVFGYWARAATCPEALIYWPKTIAETALAVRQTVINNRTVRVKAKSHSMSDLMCGQGNIISIEYLKTIDEPTTLEGVETVTFDAGVTFKELQDFLHVRGKAIKGLVSPGYGDITILGGLATGLHGSNTQGPSEVATKMVSLEVIDPRGDRTTYTRGTTGLEDPDRWRAMMTHLGLFGVVVRGTIEIEDQYNLRARVIELDDADLFANGLESTVAECEHVWFQWYPSNNKVFLTCASRTTDPVTDPTARSIWVDPEIDEFLQDPFIVLMQLGACDPATECFVETIRQSLFRSNPPLVFDGPSGNTVHVDEIVGFSHLIQTSLQTNISVIPPGYEWVFAVPSRHALDVLQYAKARIQGQDRCLPLNAFMIRFGEVHDAALLSMQAQGPGFELGEQVAVIELPIFLPYGFSESQLEAYFAPFLDVLHYAVDNYGARVHWGKNREDVFSDLDVIAGIDAGGRLARYQTVMDEMDPYGVFANEFLGRSGFEWPHLGEDFVPIYFPECVSSMDGDGDGLTDCFELANGSDPAVYNGLKVTIDDFLGDGSCNKMDDYAEMESRYQSPREVAVMRAGWEFNSKNHTYTSSTYSWDPRWSRSGKRTWKVRFEGLFRAPTSGRYCFDVTNGSSGGGIVDGWNSCAQIWVDQVRMSEAGYNASNHAEPGCIDLSSGESYRLDLVGRYHNANVGRPFIYSTRYCVDEGGADCVPDTGLPLELLTPIP